MIRQERPYDDEDAFLEAEGWTLHGKGMTVLDHPPLPVDTKVRCYVTLASGVTLVKAEGIVTGYREPSEDHPGGLEIKFRRVASETQKLIKRVPRHSRPSRPRAEQYSLLDLELDASQTEPADTPALEAAPPEVAAAPSRAPSAPPQAPSPPAAAPPSAERADLAALRDRRRAPVEPPSNRDDLLGRLRARRSSS